MELRLNHLKVEFVAALNTFPMHIGTMQRLCNGRIHIRALWKWVLGRIKILRVVQAGIRLNVRIDLSAAQIRSVRQAIRIAQDADGAASIFYIHE